GRADVDDGVRLAALDPTDDLECLFERDREAAVGARGRAGGHDAENTVLAVLERPAGVARYDRCVRSDHVVQRLGVAAFVLGENLLVEGDDPAARRLRRAAATLRVAAG